MHHRVLAVACLLRGLLQEQPGAYGKVQVISKAAHTVVHLLRQPQHCCSLSI